MINELKLIFIIYLYQFLPIYDEHVTNAYIYSRFNTLFYIRKILCPFLTPLSTPLCKNTLILCNHPFELKSTRDLNYSNCYCLRIVKCILKDTEWLLISNFSNWISWRSIHMLAKKSFKWNILNKNVSLWYAQLQQHHFLK